MFDASVKDLPQNWDLWYLGYTPIDRSANPVKTGKIISKYLREAKEIHGFYAIAINVNFLKKHINDLYAIHTAFDLYFREIFQNNNDCRCVMSEERLIGHDTGISDNYEINLQTDSSRENYW